MNWVRKRFSILLWVIFLISCTMGKQQGLLIHRVLSTFSQNLTVLLPYGVNMLSEQRIHRRLHPRLKNLVETSFSRDPTKILTQIAYKPHSRTFTSLPST